MKFDPILSKATFIRRYKRFLADIRLANGDICTIHCPNTGSMLNCLVPESDCWYSLSDNPRRKYSRTWEITTTPQGHRACINTHRANPLVHEAIDNGLITELQGYDTIQPEVRYGVENSRIDFLLSTVEHAQCYVEVKSVTLEGSDGLGFFPDAVSTRGSKHLRELMAMVAQGHRAVLVFCVQHTGIDRVAPADHIDTEYGEILRQAAKAGVELLAYKADVGADEITIRQSIPVLL